MDTSPVAANTMNYNWPTKGDKLTFLTAEGWFYPHFTSVINFAKSNLSCGKEYTVKKCEVYSSWCGVWLEEVEHKHPFHLSMFDWRERKREKLKKTRNRQTKKTRRTGQNIRPKTMRNPFVEIKKDIQNFNLPKNPKSWDKIEGHLEAFDKIYWYYADEEEFWHEEKLNPKDYCSSFGVLVPPPGTTVSNFNPYEEGIVIVQSYPCEKCEPETDWISLKRLVDVEDLVKIYTK